MTLTYEYDGNLITNEAWSGALSGSVLPEFTDDFLLRTEGVNGAHHVDFGRDHDSLPILIGDVLFDEDPPYADPNGTVMALTWDPTRPCSPGEHRAS